MPINARVISLRVRARHSSDHAFNVAGIIESANANIATLGTAVTAFDVRADLYPHLGDAEMSSGQPTGRLLFDSAGIRAALAPRAAFVLSNEALAADLDQAVIRRQRQFIAFYQFANQIQTFAQAAYPAKVNELRNLLQLTDQHFQALEAAYNPASGPPMGVTSPRIVMATRVSGMGSAQESTTHILEGGAEKQLHNHVSNSWTTKWDNASASWVPVKDAAAVALSQETVSVSENDELRHPNLENRIRHSRLTVDLTDEILSESMFSLRMPNLARLLALELADLDLDIRRLQVQFAETFLLPRLSGIVTGVMKEAGDNIRAGEPVLRIEDSSQIELVGQLKCLGAISVGQNCTVETTNVFEGTPPVPLSLAGRVVSVRGYDAESDKWNVIIQCPNAGAVRLPLGYDFESHPDFTRVTLQ